MKNIYQFRVEFVPRRGFYHMAFVYVKSSSVINGLIRVQNEYSDAVVTIICQVSDDHYYDMEGE